IDEEKQAFPALAREPRQDYGRERIIGGNRPGAARLLREHVVAIAPRSAKLEAIVGKSERLATGRGDEAAFGRGAFFLGAGFGERGLALGRPGEARAQALAIETEAALFLAGKPDGHVDRFAVAEQRGASERQNDAHFVVDNAGAVTAERLVHRLLAVLAPGDQAVLRIDQDF